MLFFNIAIGVVVDVAVVAACCENLPEYTCHELLLQMVLNQAAPGILLSVKLVLPNRVAWHKLQKSWFLW